MLAITRAVSRTMDNCQLTHIDRTPIDLARARAQHSDYERALETCGCQVQRLAEEPDLADAVFVEDTAVVVPEIAVLTRPGSACRRAEVQSVARALGLHRELRQIEAPGTLEGGDVLRVGRRVLVGQTSRTNADGIRQLATHLSRFGYAVEGLSIRGCLHLKTAVTEVAENVLLLNPDWLEPQALGTIEIIEVDPAEPFAANSLRIGQKVVFPQAFPATRDRLERLGVEIVSVDVSELAKAEGAVTCCSLLV